MTDIGRDPRSDDLSVRNVAPVIPLPRAGLSGAVIAGLCALMAISLFLLLDGNRRSMQQGSPPAAVQQPLQAPPPLAIPSAPPPPVILVQNEPRQAPFFQPVPVALRSSGAQPPPYIPPPPPIAMETASPTPAPSESNSPALVLDFTSGGGGVAVTATAEVADEGAPSVDDQAVRASIIRNRSSLVPQGTLIAAVLETPIDSRRPGLVRAIVSQDVRAFDGTRVLIPRGSRLVGEAKGDSQPGQRRVLVTWTRLIRPDGVAIRIGSPGADSLGGAGLTGRVDNHFLGRFANAVLQSALAIGVNLASRPTEGSVIVGLPGQVSSSIGQTPIFNVPAGPTIKVPQGAQISIFVARDLDFGGVAPRR